jgi:hypothetical protein
MSGIQAGVFILGTLNLEFIRNSSIIGIESSGVINLTNGASNGNFDNYNDLHNHGTITFGVSGGEFNHNAQDLWMYSNSLIDIQGGAFHNRAVIRALPTTACITASGNFNNLLGGVVLGSGGFVSGFNVDNSSNPLANWNGVDWCASNSGINVPAILEDCVTGCSALLPVELISFKSERIAGAAILRWEVGAEMNFSHYEIQGRSAHGEFLKIGEEEGMWAHGIQAYEYIDYTIRQTQEGYYRLKLIDLDGSFKYSSVVYLGAQEGTNYLRLSPNPVSDDLLTVSVGTDDRNSHVEIVDLNGRVIKRVELTKGTSSMSIDVTDFDSGVYIAKLYTPSSQEVLTERLIIQ